jgi:hypothetical protein
MNGLRKRKAVACSEAGVEAVARSGAGVEAAVCSGAEDKAVTCSWAGIEHGRWRRRHDSF